MLDLVKRVLRRSDAQKCLLIILVAIVAAYLVGRFLSANLSMLAQIVCYALAMMGVFSFSRIVQAEQQNDDK